MRVRTLVRAAAAAALSACLGAMLLGRPAAADPPPSGSLCGVGSETTEEVMQGLAPLSSGRIENWHATILATGVVCDGVPITRPASSSEGRDALFRSMGATVPTPWAVSPVPVGSGIIGFARSSIQPPTGEVSASGDVIYIPFALESVTWATDDVPIAALSGASLTPAQLTTLYQDCGTVSVPGGTLNPSQSGGNVDLFIPQPGSGVRGFWQSAVAPAGFGSCVFDRYHPSTGQPVVTGGVLNADHDGAVLRLNGSAITPFSIPEWVSQANGLLPDIRQGAALHPIGGTAPTTGPGSPVAGNPGFPVTRPVFNVVPAGLVAGPINTPTELAFVGSGSGVCINTATITDYGFIDLSANATDPWTCGATTLRAYPALLP